MTRDPARIDPILADLRRYWHAAPDRAAANQPPPDHRDTLPPEIEAAIADAGQALVDAWDSAQDGPPHRFVVFVDPEGDPEVAAGWMAMARMHAAALAAAREAGRREVLEGAAPVADALDDLSTEFCISSYALDPVLAAIAADKARAVEAGSLAALDEIRTALGHAVIGDEPATATIARILDERHRYGEALAARNVAPDGLRPVLSREDAERLVDAHSAESHGVPSVPEPTWPARTALLAALTGAGGGS